MTNIHNLFATLNNTNEAKKNRTIEKITINNYGRKQFQVKYNVFLEIE